MAGITIDEVLYRDERLPGIANAVLTSGADVVLLQEVFARRHAEALTELLSVEYPYHARHESQRWIGVGHGLLSLSKYKLRESEFVPFRATLSRERLLFHRGFHVMDLQVPVVGCEVVRIVNLHVTSGRGLGPESAAANRMRDTQLGEVHAAVKAGTVPSLVCGDFNAGPEASAENYEHFLSLGYEDAVVAGCRHGRPGPTWIPGNALVSGFTDSPPQRIDHVLLDSRATSCYAVTDSQRVFGEATVSAGGHRVTLSDHYGVLVELRAH